MRRDESQLALWIQLTAGGLFALLSGGCSVLYGVPLLQAGGWAAWVIMPFPCSHPQSSVYLLPFPQVLS
jgi:hypothetical protein